MKHLTNLAIVLVVLLFTKTYSDLISFNSLVLDEWNLMLRILLIAFTIQWLAFIPAFIFQLSLIHI